MTISRSSFVKAVAAAGVALAALGTASVAQARDNVYFSIGAHVAPGVSIGVSNAHPYYPQPVYVQPQPVYVQPQPYYVQPAPVYYPRPVYVAPPAYIGYSRPGFHRDHRWHDWDHDHRRGHRGHRYDHHR